MTEGDITIRRAEADDLQAVRALLAETWHDTYDAIMGADWVSEVSGRWHAVENLGRQLLAEGSSFLVAIDQGKVIGHILADAREAPLLVISRLYVHPAHQRGGVGGRLLDAALAEHPDCDTLRLEVEAQNEKGVAFYRRAGFSEAQTGFAITTLTTYAVVAAGILLVLGTIGAQWSKLQWLVAALGVGIGFGLQEIVANFISGLIILFERPVRIGDTVTVGETIGTVTRIQIRATTIRDWDGLELLVPNKEFITSRLLNWTLSDPTSRITIPVGLAYGGDVQHAMALMLEAAAENPEVLADPRPNVIFDKFGDNALSLKLRCFVGSMEYRIRTISELHQAINSKFNAAGLVVAFPQQDVHLDTSRPLDIRIRRDDGESPLSG